MINPYDEEKIINGRLYFDSLILGGLKYYAIKSNKYIVDIRKCKGYKQSEKDKLTYKRFQDNDIKQDNVMQFRCGLMGYMNEETPFKINKSYVSKSCKMFYTKGKQVENSNFIIPLTI